MRLKNNRVAALAGIAVRDLRSRARWSLDANDLLGFAPVALAGPRIVIILNIICGRFPHGSLKIELIISICAYANNNRARLIADFWQLDGGIDERVAISHPTSTRHFESTHLRTYPEITLHYTSLFDLRHTPDTPDTHATTRSDRCRRRRRRPPVAFCSPHSGNSNAADLPFTTHMHAHTPLV